MPPPTSSIRSRLWRFAPSAGDLGDPGHAAMQEGDDRQRNFRLIPKQIEEHRIRCADRHRRRARLMAQIIDAAANGSRAAWREAGSAPRRAAVNGWRKQRRRRSTSLSATVPGLPDRAVPHERGRWSAPVSAGVATGHQRGRRCGGDILFIEVPRMPGKTSSRLTGQLKLQWQGESRADRRPAYRAQPRNQAQHRCTS